jgi:hypothetical protein
VARGISRGDAGLGVLDPPGGAGVLPRDTRRMGALLEGPGLVQDQDGVRIAERLHDVGPQVVANPVGVPVGPAQQVPDAVRGVFADLLGELPRVLARHRGQEADAGDQVQLLPPVADFLGADDGAGAGHGDPPWAIPRSDYQGQGLATTVVLGRVPAARVPLALPVPGRPEHWQSQWHPTPLTVTEADF